MPHVPEHQPPPPPTDNRGFKLDVNTRPFQDFLGRVRDNFGPAFRAQQLGAGGGQGSFAQPRAGSGFSGLNSPAANIGDQASFEQQTPMFNDGQVFGAIQNANAQAPAGQSAEDKYSWLFNRGPSTGGSAGYDNRGAVSAYFDAMRQEAEADKLAAQQDLTSVYDQLASMIQPMAGQTAAAYNDAIGAGADQSEALIADTQARINADAAMRAAAFAELGISGGGELSDTAMEAERGMSDIGANAANWGGLMGAFSTGQQSRMNQDYVGAGDAKVMAIEDLVSRYSDYLQNINSQESNQMATAYQPGSAGTPGKMRWEELGSPGVKMLEQALIAAGDLDGPAPEEPYMPKTAQEFQYLIDQGLATEAEINFMLESKNTKMADPTNSLYNPLVTPYI